MDPMEKDYKEISRQYGGHIEEYDLENDKNLGKP